MRHGNGTHIFIYNKLLTNRFFEKARKTIKTMKQKTNVKPIDSTPFYVVEQKKKFIIVCGNVKICQTDFATERKAIEYVKSKPYELILNTAMYMFETIQKEKNNESKIETNKEGEAEN